MTESDREQGLNQQIERLTRSNDDLYQFAFLAAHELQAPLRAMEGFLSLLQESYGADLSEEAQSWLTEACSAADRMGLLTRALLILSRVDSQDIEFEPVDTYLALDDALRNLKPIIDEKNADIKIGSLPTIAANRPLLMILFQNLISNALKFCAEQPCIEIGARQSGDDWLFSVSDNGVGFDMKYIDRLFKRFERLHARTTFTGSGLGLALCKRIVDRHGGAIWAESSPGQGSSFHFTVPLSKGGKHA